MSNNMIYMKKHVFLMNFTFRRKYDYLLQQHLQKIFEAYRKDQSRISRNGYIKQAVWNKIQREKTGTIIEIPRKVFSPFPKGQQIKVQFSFSINHFTEKELYESLLNAVKPGTLILDYIRDAVYEQMLLEQISLEENTAAPRQVFSLDFTSEEDADIIGFLNSLSGDSERRDFIKQSVRKLVQENNTEVLHTR